MRTTAAYSAHFRYPEGTASHTSRPHQADLYERFLRRYGPDARAAKEARFSSEFRSGRVLGRDDVAMFDAALLASGRIISDIE